MMERLSHDPIFFYAVAYVIFLVVAWIFVRKPGLQWIDNAIGDIRYELDEAKKLRVEAETTLATAAAKKAQAVAEAAAILGHAKEEAARLKIDADAQLKFVLARHEQHSLQRIRLMEEEAVAAVRSTVVDQAMAAVRKALAGQMDAASVSKLADQAIADMPRLTVDKAKAA